VTVGTRHVVTASLLLSLAGCGAISGRGVSNPGVPGLEDGQVVALLIVGRSESDALTVGVDLAEPLQGEEARRAAIKDGVIGEGDELVNDFYLDNPESTYELLQFGDTPEIMMIAAQSVEASIAVTPQELVQLWEGTHPGQDGFYLEPLRPIPMTVVVSDGRIVSATQVYLPRRQSQSS
jgi:hypothetical protein